MNKRFTILEAKDLLEKNEITESYLHELVEEKINKYANLNFYISKINHKNQGIPFGLKDVFFKKNTITTGASQMLSKFFPTFNATIVERLEKCGMGFNLKLNLDEFAMGSTGKTSAFGYTGSPWFNEKGEELNAGGSSSGSVIATLVGACLGATGTDTGGSIRQPAAWTGLIGFKPTYGALSRYGILALSSLVDCPGFITQTVSDCKYLFNNTRGKDLRDATSIDVKEKDFSQKKKIGIIKELPFTDVMLKTKELLSTLGYEFVEISIPLIDYTLAIYGVLCPSIASSELSRYNGIFYGNRNYKGLQDIYENCRTECFGEEVKRRILIGNMINSAENFEKYYNHARRILTLINEQFEMAFQEVDFFLCPTAPDPLTKNEVLNNSNPMKIYECDRYTAFSNLLGYCAINIPISMDKTNHYPESVQLVGQPLEDLSLLDISEVIDNNFQFVKKEIWTRF